MNASMSHLPIFLCVGLSHRHAPVEIRERVAIDDAHLAQAFSLLTKSHAIQEAAILSTCNRLELYAVTATSASPHSLEVFLHDFHNLPSNTLTNYLYSYSGIDAAKQLFRVATALDALVVGEPQILGQVKHAYQQAKTLGATGPMLHGLFDKALYAAKRVRTETKLSSNAVTVSFAAVELARKVFGELRGLTCILVGAGEMSELAAKHLHKRGTELIFSNRSLERAQQLADRFSGTASPLSDLEHILPKADIVLTSTAAGHIVVNKSHIKKAMRTRRYKPMLFIDIAVPRNIDPDASALDGVYLYDIDDLGSVVHDNLALRQKEVELAEKIIAEEILFLHERLNEQRAAPLIKQLKLRANSIVESEVSKTLASLKHKLTHEECEQILAMGHGIANKLLHTPITQLKSSLHSSDGAILQMTKRLFNVEK